jgi:hypothetical protein
MRNKDLAFKQGAQLAPERLEADLKTLQLPRYRRTLTHGDLHGENVRVAGVDAILIDFNSITHGPLVADPAVLDVSLIVGSRILVGDAWMRFAEKAFALDNLRLLPPPPDPTEAAAQFWEQHPPHPANRPSGPDQRVRICHRSGDSPIAARIVPAGR